MHNDSPEDGLVGYGLVLRGSRGANDACWHGRVIQDLGNLRTVRNNVVGRLNGGIGAVVIGNCRKGDLRRTAGDLCTAEMKCRGRGIEFRVKTVREGLECSVHDVTTGVSELSGVLLDGLVKDGMEIDVMQIEVERSGLIVVKHLAIVQHRVADAEIEDAGVAVGVAALDGGDIRMPVLVDVDLHNGVIDLNVVQIPLLLQDRNDAHAGLGMLQLQKGRIGRGAGAIDGDAVNVQTQIR